MKITVEFDDAERSRGTLTIWPSWIGRLFGRRPRAARIERGYGCWHYEIDNHILSSDLDKIVDDQRRWQEVSAVPPVCVVTHRSSR